MPPAQRIIEKPGRKTEYRIDEPVTLSDLIQFPDGVTNVWVYNWAATAASTEEYFQVDINASFYLKQAGIIGMGDWELVVTEDKENPSNNDVALAVSI